MMANQYCDHQPFSPTVQDGQELISPCLAPDYTGEWEHAEVTYTLRGQKAGIAKIKRT